jgi:hypothetical protein
VCFYVPEDRVFGGNDGENITRLVHGRIEITSLNPYPFGIRVGISYGKWEESGTACSVRLHNGGHDFKFPLKCSLLLYIQIVVSRSPPMGKAAGRAVISYNLGMSLLMARTSLY